MSILLYGCTTWTLTKRIEKKFDGNFPGRGHIDTAVWMHYLDANKTAEEEARRQLHKNAASNIEQVLEVTPHKTETVGPSTTHHENYPS